MNLSRIVLFITVCVISLITVMAVINKNKEICENVPETKTPITSTPKVPQIPQTPTNPLIPQPPQQNNDVVELNKKLDDLTKENQKNVQQLKDNTWLLALIHNQNVAAIQQNRLDKMVFIMPNWKINRMPDLISITPEQQEIIKRKFM